MGRTIFTAYSERFKVFDADKFREFSDALIDGFYAPLHLTSQFIDKYRGEGLVILLTDSKRLSSLQSKYGPEFKLEFSIRSANHWNQELYPDNELRLEEKMVVVDDSYLGSTSSGDSIRWSLKKVFAELTENDKWALPHKDFKIVGEWYQFLDVENVEDGFVLPTSENDIVRVVGDNTKFVSDYKKQLENLELKISKI